MTDETPESPIDDEPLWYRDAIIYEFHVRAFHDSNGDGVGDFAGLTEKLDYLQDLGITALWLLPFYPSPLKDDGYDIANYTDVNPAYGTLRDFKNFLREAHRRGLRVITELVLNHTSDQHPWFQRARRAAPGDPERDFYVWSDSPERYPDARIIFKDFESSNWTWDPVAKAYYWHRFYSHQPDLNFDNPQVKKAMFQALDFWLGMGVDGLRLDAVPYLYEREGTTCENLPETHSFLKELRRHVDRKYRNRLLLAEANQWPEDGVAYFGQGDECHMAFHFPLMPRLFMAIRMEDRFPIIDILEQTPRVPPSCQWATFLRNHDELTLEMVTDEERDYMYRVYAENPHARINLGIRRRLAPLLENNRRRIELMNGLLFSLIGTPVIYYGDEIGMGDNIYLGDRNGVRTPLQWNSDRNAGFSRANPQKLFLPIIIDPEYHYEAINVEAQQNNTHSLLWWMKRLISLRKRFRALGRGDLELLSPRNRKVLAFVRRYQDEALLVVANLSRFVQFVELDLSSLSGITPVEVFGATEFPPVGKKPYFLTLGPHAFYWFSLEAKPAALDRKAAPAVSSAPLISVAGEWEDVFSEKLKAPLEQVLLKYLQERRWFGGKARKVSSLKAREALSLPYASSVAHLTTIRVEYTEGDPETYLLPITFASGERGERISKEHSQGVIAHLSGKTNGLQGVLYDALMEKDFSSFLLETIARRRRMKGPGGEVTATPSAALKKLADVGVPSLEPSLQKAEQSNSSVIFGESFFLKVFRRLEPGMNPDLEIGRFLTEKGFPHSAPVVGCLEYRSGNGEPMTLGILQRYIPQEGDGWQYTLDALGRFSERAMMLNAEGPPTPPGGGSLVELAERELPRSAQEMLGTYLQWVELLAQRTAELHVRLSSEREDPRFAPEPYTAMSQRSFYQSRHNLTNKVLDLLRDRLPALPEPAGKQVKRLLDLKGEILKRFHAVLERKLTSMRIRIHGDYHLGQVLFTGKDFVIIDFEGEPARPLSERRLKRSPLRDVAGMLRSFHYAAHAAPVARSLRPEDRHTLLPWIRSWHRWVAVAYLKSYLATAGTSDLLPGSREELEVLLESHLLEKAIYELGYELNNRPEWLDIPLRGILETLGQPEND